MEKIIEKDLINKKIEEYNNGATAEMNLYQMYLYNENNEYHYSIPYYSDHTESQNMIDIDDIKYNPLGNFAHNKFNIEGIFNNGVYVSNEDIFPSWLYEHYTRFTGLE
ncbi:hypothetical protein EZS27_035080 [termite gut metagenome]|uniref:Uncharacterized protein n=1 Tax=termite gut metagenome TaxID=433724 RepID=A0A5J4PX88_9ZZZZ